MLPLTLINAIMNQIVIRPPELILRVCHGPLGALQQDLLLFDLPGDKLGLGSDKRRHGAQPHEFFSQLVQPLLPLFHLHLDGFDVAAPLHPFVDLSVAHFLRLDREHLRVDYLEIDTWTYNLIWSSAQ